MAWSTEISQLVTETEQFIDAVELKKPTLDAAANTAVLNATAGSASATEASVIATASTTSADVSKGHAVATEAIANLARMQADAVSDAERQASLAAGYALSANTIVQQDLSGVTAAALHRSPNAVTSMFVYDTSKDSDGGAWTEKCQNTSWYNEDVSGKWLGAQVSELEARNVGSTLGVELISNVGFDSDTWWGKDAGWSISNGLGISAGSTAQIYTPDNLVVANKTYCVTLDLVSYTSGTLRIVVGTTVRDITSPVLGRYTVYLTTTGSGRVRIGGASAFTGSIDNVSVKEVTALNTSSNDYFQLTTDGKFYRLWKNLLSNTELFTAAPAWLVGSNITRTTGYADPFGTMKAAQITAVTSGTTVAGNYIRQFTALNIYSSGTSSVWVRRVTGTGVVKILSLNNATTGLDITATISSSWTRVEFAGAAGGGYLYFGVGVETAGDVIEIAFPQLELGAIATTYEAKENVYGNSEVFRGNKRDFPRLAGIVSEATSVIIYDLTEAGRPMWMRFPVAYGALINATSVSSGSSALCLYASNGIFAVIGAPSGLFVFTFPTDKAEFYRSGNSMVYYTNPLSSRLVVGPSVFGTGGLLASSTIYSLAMTVLPDAPIDPVTGLKVPTIAVATNGGASIIKHNGTVVNSALTTQWFSVGINSKFVYGTGSGAQLFSTPNPGALNASFTYTTTNTNAAPGYIGHVRDNKSEVLLGIYGSPSLLRLNRDAISRSLLSRVGNNFNTGWMPGDIRRAYLADTTAEVIGPSSNVVTNGDFATDVTGWTSFNGGSIAWASGSATVTGAGVNTTGVYQTIPCVIGKPYRFQVTVTLGTTASVDVAVNLNPTGSGGSLGNTYVFVSTNQTVIRYFIATATTHSVTLLPRGAGLTATFDNVIVEEVVLDRSYKAQGALINGTLTKSQLASGTSLVGYSGFSTTNYLQEPYSTDLDFGTGEFSASTWVNIPVTLPASSFEVIGTERLTNGDFSNGSTGWVLGSGTTVTDGVVTVGAGGTTALVQTNVLQSGKFYRITFTLVSSTVGNDAKFHQSSWAPLTNLGDAPISYGPGTYTIVLQQINNNIDFRIANFSGPGFQMDNISVREVGPTLIFDRASATGLRMRFGVNRFGQLTAEAFDGTSTRTVTTAATYNTAQWLKAEVNYTTDGSLAILVNGREVAVTRGTPLLSLNSKYNLLDYSNQLNIGYTVTNGSIVQGASDPFGGSTAWTLTATSGNATLFKDVTVPSLSTCTVSLYVRRKTGSGSITFYTPGGTPTSIAVTNDWQRFTLSGAVLATTCRIRVQLAVSSDEIDIAFGQVEISPTARTYQRVGITTDFDFQAPLTIGNSFATDAPFPGSIALLKLSATVPTAEQSTFMYEQEKQLFRTDAVSVLPDANSILDMSYDDATDRWSAVSATNESYWAGLVRNSVTPVPAGSYSKITTTSGIELTSRTTTNPGVDVSIPTYLLREDLNKRAEAASKTFKEIVNFDYVGGFTASTTIGSTAITSVANLTYPVSPVGARISGAGIPTNATIVSLSGTTIYISAAATATATGVSISFLDFNLPTGFEAETVATAGAIRREGTTADFTRLFDGFIETIRFAVAPGSTTWVQIQASRILS